MSLLTKMNPPLIGCWQTRWWARIMMRPLALVGRWIREFQWPSFPLARSQTAQLMPRYPLHNVIPVHRRHYCHADNGARKWGHFQNCHVGCQSCPPLVSNMCQIQIESGVLSSHRRLVGIGCSSASPHKPLYTLWCFCISLKGYVTIQMNSKSVTRYSNLLWCDCLNKRNCFILYALEIPDLFCKTIRAARKPRQEVNPWNWNSCSHCSSCYHRRCTMPAPSNQNNERSLHNVHLELFLHSMCQDIHFFHTMVIQFLP